MVRQNQNIFPNVYQVSSEMWGFDSLASRSLWFYNARCYWRNFENLLTFKRYNKIRAGNILQNKDVFSSFSNNCCYSELCLRSCIYLEAHEFGPLRNLKFLERLDLHNNRISPVVLFLIYRNNTGLRHLNLGTLHSPLPSNNVMAMIDDCCPQIETLNLCNQGRLAVIGIGNESCCSILRELDIRNW